MGVGRVRGRLDLPDVRKGCQLCDATWAEAFDAIRAANAGSSVAAIAGDMADCETMFAARALVTALGGHLLEGRQTGLDYDVTSLSAVNFNTGDRKSTRLNSSH